MKKLIFTMSLLIAGVGSLMAARTYTAKADLTLGATTLKLRECADFSDAFDNGYDAENANAFGINVVATLTQGTRWANWYTNELDGAVVGFTANNGTHYTISFANVTGTTLYLFDKVANVFTEIVAGENYAFDVTAAQVGTTINDRFIISKNILFTVTTNTSGYATYSNSLDLVLEDAQAGDPKVCSAAYSVVSDEEGLLTLHVEAGVPANTGVIIRGAASTTYTLVPATIAPFTSTNVLEASVTETTNSGALCMATIGGVCAFYEYTGAMISANKAYLPLSVLTEGGVAAPKRVRMVVEGATALDANASTSTKVEKIMVNGQVYILRDGQRYDVMGQIVK